MRPGTGDGRRVRLRLLTIATTAAWLVAVIATSAPALAAGADTGRPGMASPSGAPAKPKATATPTTKAKPTSPPRATPKPDPTPKASPRPTPRASGRPAATPTPTPEPTAKPHPTPAGSPATGSGPAITPKPHGQGSGAAPGSHAGSTSGRDRQADTAGASSPDAGTTSPDVFAVPGAGLALTAMAGGTTVTETGAGPLEAEIYVDVRFATSMDWLAPAALLAVPALLIALSLVAQLVGGVLWIPLTNRVLGGRAVRP